MKDAGILYDNWSNFKAIWYNSCPLGIICGNLEYFLNFWYDMMYQEKSGNHGKHL
jgi:hypothetical protein